MISYKQWQILQESFGTFTLGVKSPHNLGFVSNHHTTEEPQAEPCDDTCDSCGQPLDEMGMRMRMPMYMDDEGGPPMKKHGKKPMPPHHPPHPDDMGDEDMGPMDDMGDDLGDDDMDIDPDAELDGDDMGDDMGGDDDMGDLGLDDIDGDDMGGDDMGGHPFPPKKKGKHPMGEPHKGGPFMQFSRRMKAEGCGDKGKDKGKGKDEDMGDDSELVGKGDKGKELAFLQKKTMKKKMASGDTTAKDSKLGTPKNKGKAAPKGNGGVKHGTPEKQNYSTGKTMASHSAKAGQTDAGFKKGCSTGDDGKIGMCKNCKKQKKMKEANDYARPQDVDMSDNAFLQSLKSMYGNPTERFSDGLRDVSEDLLLHPDLVPGEPGHPSSLHNHNEPAVTESLGSLQKRIADLEKQLKNK